VIKKPFETIRRAEFQPYDVSPCPLCGASAAVWHESATFDSPVMKVVMCENEDFVVDPEDSLLSTKCLLYLPPQSFYHDRAVDAVAYWNRYAAECCKKRSEQNLSVIRKIEVLELKPDDALIFTIEQHLSMEVAERVESALRSWLPGYKIIVLDRSMEVKAIRPASKVNT
jgi:hypothetical protein